MSPDLFKIEGDSLWAELQCGMFNVCHEYVCHSLQALIVFSLSLALSMFDS